MMVVSSTAVMALKSYQNQAELLINKYLLADPFIPYTSVLCGLFACKVIYDICQLLSASYSKSYLGLSKIQRVDWNNRSLFGMTLWLYPSLGGIDYVIHHSLSATAVAYAMLRGEGQLYTYMVRRSI